MSRQFPLPLPHDVAMKAEDFLVAPCNEQAIGWINRWPDWPNLCLAIAGPAGSGKTHLTQIWLERCEGMAVEAAQLSRQNAADITVQYKCIAIDNADTVSGDTKAEETLFHLYNHLKEIKGFLLLTCQLPPAQWQLKLPDLRSRLSTAPVATIAGPDDALLSALLIKQFRDRQVDIPEEVVHYLLPRIERSAKAVNATVTELDRMSLAERRPVTVALARRMIEGLV